MPSCRRQHHEEKEIYGEFIRTFLFTSPELPIIQPGQALPLPIATVRPSGVRSVDNKDEVGIIVPRGVYLVNWTLNPNNSADVQLLVNNRAPVTSETKFPYTQSITTDNNVIQTSWLVEAPHERHNLISLVNVGASLITLGDIPNSKIGNVSVITHLRLRRIARLHH
jgi:hypothetical protein